MARAALEIRPAIVTQGDVIQISGSGWPSDAIVFTIGKKERAPDRVLAGSQWDGLLVPLPGGSFLVELATDSLKPGSVAIRAAARGGKAAAEAKLQVRERVRWGPKVPREKLDKPAMRGLAFKHERVRDGRWPKGFSLAMRRDWIRKFGPRQTEPGGIVFYSAPIPGACNWVPLGPAPFTHGKGSMHGSNSGRTRCLAIDPLTPSRMYIGTASGGVWKSVDGGATWAPKTDDKFSLAIGALAIDPLSPNIVYAGTGEYVPGSDYGYYYGRGLLRSTDFGETWSEIGVIDFDLAEIARIVVNPNNPANLFVAASNGIWESASSGASWTQLTPNACTDLVLVQNPAEPGTRRVIAGFSSGAVRQSVDSGGGWGSFTSLSVPGAPAGARRTVFGVCRTQPRFMYAAFCESGGINFAHVARSEDWGQTWAARNIPATGSLWSAHYNMAIQPHPTAPDTVLLGVVNVFKSIDGGMSWTPISVAAGVAVHADVHAIVWHPTDPNRLFVTCDGGVFTTPDLGATWQARNLDIAALQFYDLGQHPAYDAIMVGGTQDNGGFHYNGAPIWKRTWVAPGVVHNEMGGDGVVAQIDPFNGYVHYYGTGPESSASRSDNAGILYDAAWWTFFPGTQWWSPFYCDPRTAGVVFTGGTRVWRSDARGDAGTWADITNDLAEPLRSLGFHPTNARVLYAGTIGGHVYKLTGPPAGAWTAGTVTKEDVTFTGLPAAIGISSIAVDGAGTVWITSSDIVHTEATGEFSNHHVFRLDAGATAWVAKSDGLVVANPINAIVIDPADSTRLFCGGDRGVFAWDAATEEWNALDQGLPNAPVIKLAIHGPSRLLRAATHGRGVWERSLDGLGCSDSFLYLRDNLVDSGRTPSPDHVAHPYIAGELCHHWQSEDIVVDSVMQTPALVTSAMDLYDKVVHLGAQRGPNRVYLTVHNKGPFAVTGASARLFFAPASMGLPPFPSGLLADPFGWNPAGASDWTPVSLTAFSIGRIEPGSTRLASWNFTVPMTAPRHSCLLAFVTSAEDPFATGGISSPDDLVVNNRKVALRNLDLEAMPGGGSGGDTGGGGSPLPAGFVARELRMYGHDWARAAVLCADVPDDALFIVAVDRAARKSFIADEPKLSRRAEKMRGVLARACARELPSYDFDKAIVREAKAGAEVVIGRTRLKRDRPVALFVAMHSAKWDRARTYAFDVVQEAGEKIVGGYTVRIADLRLPVPPGRA
jgi:photosystem II stability/assembly factor-like uncharacterized protein